ncbi:hypothetical protein DFH28DRAFT_285138 [Melampsora americana]|nr:hypothetical protein DFH28DRAFT_285138 [Melampsora americana]
MDQTPISSRFQSTSQTNQNLNHRSISTSSIFDSSSSFQKLNQVHHHHPDHPSTINMNSTFISSSSSTPSPSSSSSLLPSHQHLLFQSNSTYNHDPRNLRPSLDLRLNSVPSATSNLTPTSSNPNLNSLSHLKSQHPSSRGLWPNSDMSISFSSRPSSPASFVSSLHDHDQHTNTSSTNVSVPMLKPSTSQVLLFPTRAGVKQRVSIHQPIGSLPATSGRARAPMVPVSMNSRHSFLSSSGSQLQLSRSSNSFESSASGSSQPTVASAPTSGTNLTTAEEGGHLPSSGATSNFGKDIQTSSDRDPERLRDEQSIGEHSSVLSSTLASHQSAEDQSTPSDTHPKSHLPFKDLSSSKPLEPPSIPILQLSLDQSDAKSLLDFDFDTMLPSTNLTDFLGKPTPESSLHPSTIADSTSNSQGHSNSPREFESSKRDTLKSFADLIKTDEENSIKTSLHLSPPDSHAHRPDHVFPTPQHTIDINSIKTQSSNLSTPLLLDLDISGTGPSLGSAKLTSASLRDDGFDEYDLKLDTKPHHERSDTMIYTSEASEDHDPYFPTSLSDHDDEDDIVNYDDVQSIVESSSCDSHSRQPSRSEIKTSPYLQRSAPSRMNGTSYDVAPGCIGNAASGVLKRGMSKLKLPQTNKIGYRDDVKHTLSPSDLASVAGQTRDQPDKNGFISPSPVSSMVSFNTINSRTSSKNSGNSRMARLISRVTGSNAHTHNVKPQSFPAPTTLDSNQNRAHVPTIEIKTLKKKGSLSNILESFGSKDKAKPNSASNAINSNGSSVDHSTQRPTIARKSTDLLLRPFTKSRTHTDPQPIVADNADNQTPTLPEKPATRPTLRAKRSFDMLRSKLTSGRKSMDELSAFTTRPNNTSLITPLDLSSHNDISRLPENRPSEPFMSPNTVLSPSESLPPVEAQLPGASVDINHARSGSSGSSDSEQNQICNSSSGLNHKLASSDHGSHAPPQSNDHHQGPSAEIERSIEVQPAPQIPSKEVDSARIIDGQSTKEWANLDSVLTCFQASRGQPVTVSGSRVDLTNFLTGTLLPFLKAEESHTGSVYVNQKIMTTHHKILFGWLDLIFAELREPQPASRGACLDGVAGILESHFLASYIINSNPAAVTQYRQVLVSVLSFAVDKLNDKAVYANTLVFAGRMLAMAFFRIEGVARKLLRALPPVKRMSMRRILDEMQQSRRSVTSERPNLQPFPSYLRELCFTDLASYCRVFSNASTESDNVLIQEGAFQVEMSGNWLIRWTASDSDLPFAFYRAYHRQLATYLRPQPNDTIIDSLSLVSMPGFLFIAASFLDKCDSLVHRSLRSVTTLGPNTNSFNAGESANLAMGAKPKVLELAHRRLISTALDIVGGSPAANAETDLTSEFSRRRNFFGGLLNVWIRAITKRTSMWDTRSVFLLLDFFDGLFYTVLYTAPIATPADNPPTPKLAQSSLRLFDVSFILDVVRRILTTADNTVCVMRTIAFIYSQFEALTIDPSTCDALCLDLLLQPSIFQHLFLHWNSGVRGYYMRLLVWRLSRLGVLDHSGPQTKSREAINIILTFNNRLDAIRKRHDDLSPEPEILRNKGDDYLRKRSTICSTRGVTDQPWAINELPPEEVCAETVNDHSPDPSATTSTEKPSVAKVASWLKVVKKLGGASKGRARHEAGSSVSIPAGRSELDLIPEQPSGRTEESKSPPSTPPPANADDAMKTPRKSDSSQRSTQSPDSPTFFKFEFELGAEMPRSDSFDTPLTTPTPSEIPQTIDPTSLQVSPLKPLSDNPTAPNSSTPGPRVSSRFSKRVSLLPPVALNLLKDNEMTPAAPARSFTTKPQADVPYNISKHPYAIRALAEYEQSLEEEHEWKEKLAEEEANDLLAGIDPNLNTASELIVPRLTVSWPLSFSEDE